MGYQEMPDHSDQQKSRSRAVKVAASCVASGLPLAWARHVCASGETTAMGSERRNWSGF